MYQLICLRQLFMLIGSRQFLQKIKTKVFALNFVFPTKFLMLNRLKTAGFVERQLMDFALR